MPAANRGACLLPGVPCSALHWPQSLHPCTPDPGPAPAPLTLALPHPPNPSPAVACCGLQEIHWGHVLVNIVSPAGEGQTQHCVDISQCVHHAAAAACMCPLKLLPPELMGRRRRFHDVEPQPGLDMVPPHKLARKVGWPVGSSSASRTAVTLPRRLLPVHRPARLRCSLHADLPARLQVISGGDRGALPAPIMGTNTLALSDTGCVATRDGQRLLMFRYRRAACLLACLQHCPHPSTRTTLTGRVTVTATCVLCFSLLLACPPFFP